VSWPSNVATATSFPSGLVVSATTEENTECWNVSHSVFPRLL
jgi:hypothetical protein